MHPEIIIVSGLPRSGTSLMMQMLHRGGMPTLTDGEREADSSNPNGYFELEQVKKLKTDASWVAAARNLAVKVVSQLLFDLPPTERYRVVLMERNLDEVLLSQATMLERNGRQGGPSAILKEAYRKHLEALDRWLGVQSHMKVLRVKHAAVISQPGEQAIRVNEFLGGKLDVEQMAVAVDPNLYRSKTPD